MSMTSSHLPVKRPQPRLQPRPQLSNPSRRAPPETVVPPERYFKRRTLVYTGAVAVIVITGSILGSQLKSKEQAQERRETLSALDADKSPEPTPSAINIAPGQNKNSESVIKPITASRPSDVQRQIAFLEERRGRLIGQKLSLEQKLASVKEKMRKEQELDTSRKAATKTEP